MIRTVQLRSALRCSLLRSVGTPAGEPAKLARLELGPGEEVVLLQVFQGTRADAERIGRASAMISPMAYLARDFYLIAEPKPIFAGWLE